MYIKVKSWGNMYEYYIYTANNTAICRSTSSWQTIGGAVRAAIELANDLGIECRMGYLNRHSTVKIMISVVL